MLQAVMSKWLFRNQCHAFSRVVQTIATSVVSSCEYPKQVVGINGHGQYFIKIHGRDV